MQSLSFEQIIGRCEAHLVELGSGSRRASMRMTPEAAAALGELSREAAEVGIVVAVASAYRSFDRQLAIWNDKASGRRAVLDDEGRALALDELNERERVFAILRWSALPGGSRHHWGTDVDVYDAGSMPEGYQLRLTPCEAAPGGVFHALHRWLDDRLERGQENSFFRPFSRDAGGVAPEPWHLSFAPQARLIERCLEPGALRKFLATQPMALKQPILENFEEIYWRFILPPGRCAESMREASYVADHL